MSEISNIFRSANAVDISTRRQEWTVEGWTQFEEVPASSSEVSGPQNPTPPTH
jgi:hypothetical protein